jgi:hypothetical protein
MRHVLPLVVLVTACSETDIKRINEPPRAVISAPLADALVWQGEGVLVASGLVDDSHDAAPLLTVTWTLDGESVDTTANDAGEVFLDIVPDDLAWGAHSLTLTVVDGDGDVGEDSIEWVVRGPGGPPEVAITSPATGTRFPYGEDIYFQGTASDLSSDPRDLEFVWMSNLDGNLNDVYLDGKGNTNLSPQLLREGEHLITLIATDTDGESAIAEITVKVGEEEIEIIDDPEVGDLIFSEIMVKPTVAEDVDGEWVELYNTSGYGVQIHGYSFHDDDYDFYVIEDSYVVMPGEYVVLCANVNPSQNGGVPCDVGFNRTEMGGDGAMALGNKGDEVVLSLPDGTEIDWLYYDADWYVEGVATGVDPDHLNGEDNDKLMYWCEQRTVVSKGGEPGTPGMRNDEC